MKKIVIAYIFGIFMAFLLVGLWILWLLWEHQSIRGEKMVEWLNETIFLEGDFFGLGKAKK